jgi:hypothetical protein
VCAFKTTLNKDTLRDDWDLPILQAWVNREQHEMTYFGLPGPEIRDFLAWRDVLAREKTAVESLGRTKGQQEQAAETMARMKLNVQLASLSSGFQLLRGDVEDVIIHTTDKDGAQPQLIDGAAAHLARLRYDLVNLDFDGGLGYRDASGSAKRVEALRSLLRRQRDRSFVLMLTVNVRDTMGDEFNDYLFGAHGRANNEEDRELLKWLAERGDGERDLKLKAVIPLFIHETAETTVLAVRCYPPVVYQGHERAHMLHFVFELQPQSGNLRAFGPQTPQQVMRLPLIVVEEGQFSCSKAQQPPIDRPGLRELVSFMGADRCEQLLASVDDAETAS